MATVAVAPESNSRPSVPSARSDAASDTVSSFEVASTASTVVTATHVLEDVLLGTAVAAFALDERIAAAELGDILHALVEARKKGRARELVQAAHEKARVLPDWRCKQCGDSNPATFAYCWKCAHDRPATAVSLDTQSEALLACEAAMELRRG